MSKGQPPGDELGRTAQPRCGFCGKPLAERQGVGSGALEEGLFCNLDCYALAFPMLVAQARRTAERRPN